MPTRQCQFPLVDETPCGEDGNTTRLRLTWDNNQLVSYYCPSHLPEVMTGLGYLGMKPAVVIDSKVRAMYTAASGAKFSAADARTWLREQGHLSGAVVGRLSRDHIQLYADTH